MLVKRFWVLMNEADDGTGGGGAGSENADNAAADNGNADANDGKADTSNDQKPAWPEDWQSKLSRGDEKIAKRLGRYASPEAVVDALIAAQNRISSGELKATLPKDAKPEEIAQWRKDNGIPEKPEDYNLQFDKIAIDDADKPVIDAFLKDAHARNMTPEDAKANIEWYYKEQERQTQERLAKDEDERMATQDELNAEWGANFRRNVNMIGGLIDKFPASVRDAIKSARLPDGTGLFNHPDVMRGFVSMALEIDPGGTLVPGGGGDVAKSVDTEIADIEKTMRTNRSAYNKDEKMQARYRELLEAREKLQKRAA